MLKEVKSKSTNTIILERCLFALNVSALLFGNFMTLLVLVLNRQMRTVPNMFVALPVVSDFSTGIFSNILSFYSGIVSKWPFGDATCRFQGFLSSTLALTSVHTMALMAVNRYFRIVKPGKYRQLFTKTKTKTMIVAHGFILLSVPFFVVHAQWWAKIGVPSLQEFLPYWPVRRQQCIFSHQTGTLLSSSKLRNPFFLLQNLPESS